MARPLGLAAAGVLLAACVTTYEDAPLFGKPPERPAFAVPQTIPLGAAPTAEDERLLQEVYGGILQRMQEAVNDRDLPQLEALLDGYERSNLPPWLTGRLAGYRALSRGLRFQQHAVASATLQLVPPAEAAPPDEARKPDAAVSVPPLGKPLQFQFALPAPADAVGLGGRMDDDPVGFAVAITVEDVYVDGSTRELKNQGFVWLPEHLELAGDTVLRLPVAVDVPPGQAVQRSVHVRIDLMPGYVHSGGLRAPVQRTSLAALAFTQWPAGHEKVALQPLANLRDALSVGDPANFPRVYLAASFTQGEDRETAIALLVEQVRFGRADQALVAMAALRAITGVQEPVGDREAWLAWWQARR